MTTLNIPCGPLPANHTVLINAYCHRRAPFARGFGRVTDVGAAGLKQAYFTGKNAARTVASGYGIAVARLSENATNGDEPEP